MSDRTDTKFRRRVQIFEVFV